MWRFCLVLAPSALAQSTLPQTCPAGQCLREEAADDKRAALGFVQTSLHWKLREQRVASDSERMAEVFLPNLTILSDGENPWVLPAVNGHCPLSEALGVEVPYDVSTAAKFKAFEWMGFVRKLPHCGLNQIKMLTELLSQGASVEHENRLAWKMTCIWASIVLAAIVWSIYAVAIIPRKRSSDTVKMGLADDEKAYEKGFMNYVSLGWVDELVGRYGKHWNSVIDDNEIVCNRRDDAFVPYIRFRKHWEDEVARAGSVEKASIVWALYKTVGFKAAFAMVVLTFTEELAGGVMSVVGLQYFLGSLEHLDAWANQHPGEQLSYLGTTIATLVWIWGSPMVFRFLSIIATLVDGHYTQMCASGLASIVFHKALRTPASSARPESRETADGDEEPDPWGNHKPNLVQILNVDIVDCWGGLIRDCLCVLVAPFSMIVLLSIMVKQISFDAIGGASYIVPVLFLMMCSTSIAMQYWRTYQMFMDTRLKWLTESLLSIRTIKALAWEKLAQEKLMKARDGELYCARAMAVMTGVMTAVAHTLPWGVLTITMWILLSKAGNGQIPAHQVMIVQRLIQALLGNIGQLSNGLGRAMVVPNSFFRIRRFLAQPDRPQDVVRQPTVQTQNAPALRVMGNFTYAGAKPILKDLDIAVPQGELVGIIGRVGAGKSTLLQTLIGELHPLNGSGGQSFVEAPDTSSGHIAYCAQVPWIFEGTLRENIIMNQQLHHDRYYKCIHAAGLSSDLQILPGGDQVTIGSFGIRLSGGQRARVALARAAYMEAAQVVLIDDPFASVDGPTGQHIFAELLLGPVMRGRTRLVVTQPDRARLQHFDRIILLEDGCVVETGAPAEVMETEAFKRIQQEQVDDGADSPKANSPGVSDVNQSVMLAKQANDEGGMLLREEEVAENITWESVWWWLKAAGVLNLLLLGGSVALQAVVELRESLVLAIWIDTKVINPEVNDMLFIKRLIMVVGACCATILIVYYATANVALTSARKIHECCVTSLLNAPVDRFFDKQPVGRLINRLSYDMKQVDETLVGTGLGIAQFLMGFMTTQTFVLSVMPGRVCLCALPVYAATMYFIYLYRGTAVPLVFHSKHSLSMVQDLQAVVIGQCVSIRANGMLDSFMLRYNHYSQSVIRSQYLIFYICRAWAQSRVFLCFGALTAILAIGGLWAGVPLGTLATCVGFCFFQMAQFEGISMTFTHLLNVLNALQRLMKYVSLPAEAAYDMPTDYTVRRHVKVDRDLAMRLQMKQGTVSENGSGVQVCLRGAGGKVLLEASADGAALSLASGVDLWELAPSSEALTELQGKGNFQVIAVNNVTGSAEQMARELCNPPAAIWLDLWNTEFQGGLKVEIEDLTAGYATAKSVLHGVTLQIPPCSKCAFVGKTGCGKSTTLLCILRFLEARSGRILIGGRDNAKLGLRAVRRIVGLVPQDPTIFEGTIRFNLDPFDEFPDARIWEAVHSVQLMQFIRTLPDGLDTHVDRDGSNVSFGQKQLISLARMVIRQPPVLLLDECTSALDPVTQEAVQKSILRDFPRTTIIAVAHRLETVLDFEQICVFHQGHVIERGTVQELKKLGGTFAKMLQAKRLQLPQ